MILFDILKDIDFEVLQGDITSTFSPTDSLFF